MHSGVSNLPFLFGRILGTWILLVKASVHPPVLQLDWMKGLHFLSYYQNIAKKNSCMNGPVLIYVTDISGDLQSCCISAERLDQSK